MKGICPECGELVTIGPTDKKIPPKNGRGIENGSATYKIVLQHPDPRETSSAGEIVLETVCLGTGKHL